MAFVKKLFFFQYVTYPIYFIYYSPWLVRQYKREDHARREDRDDCIIFHSLQTPTAANVTLERNGLDTMDKIFDYVSSCCLFFFVSPPSNLVSHFKKVCKTYGKSDALGTREIIAEEDEMQSNGKVFKKFVLGKYNWRTFEDFNDEATIMSQGLRHLGIGPQDRVAILAETRAEWILTAYACFKNSITIVTIYTNLGNDGVLHAIGETEVALLICSDETLPKVAGVIGQCQSVKNM